MLHFGYLIESAFLNPNIAVFDFLAGNGKNSNYKEHLATDSIALYSFQVIRSLKMRVLYGIKAFVKRVMQT